MAQREGHGQRPLHRRRSVLLPGGRLTAPLSQFQTGLARSSTAAGRASSRSKSRRRNPTAQPVALLWGPAKAALSHRHATGERAMALKSEFETTCPCCQCDARRRRQPQARRAPRRARARRSPRAVQRAAHPRRRSRPREALFQQSVTAETNRGDALSKRFEEALKQANQEPITKPTRDFDLD